MVGADLGACRCIMWVGKCHWDADSVKGCAPLMQTQLFPGSSLGSSVNSPRVSLSSCCIPECQEAPVSWPEILISKSPWILFQLGNLHTYKQLAWPSGPQCKVTDTLRISGSNVRVKLGDHDMARESASGLTGVGSTVW